MRAPARAGSRKIRNIRWPGTVFRSSGLAFPLLFVAFLA